MPCKSKAQRRKFAELLVNGKITDQTYEEWNRSTGKKELPERVTPKAKTKTSTRTKAKAQAKTKTRITATTRTKAKAKPRKRAVPKSRGTRPRR